MKKILSSFEITGNCRHNQAQDFNKCITCELSFSLLFGLMSNENYELYQTEVK